jgi:hypothetical protein
MTAGVTFSPGASNQDPIIARMRDSRSR